MSKQAAPEDDDLHLEALLEKILLEKQVGNNQEIVPNKIKQAVGKSVCKIQLPEDSWASGFFCTVELDGEQYFGLCTNNHVIDFQYIRSGSDVKCISDEEQLVYLSISNYSYTSRLLDATFLEVSFAQRTEVIGKGFSFLQVESEAREGETILVGQHPRGGDLAIETGSIIEFNEDSDGFYHSANTDYGSSGGPVTNNQGKAVGIHRGGHWKKSVARNVAVLLSKVQHEMSKDSARTPAVREPKIQRNASIFLPAVKIRPAVAPPAVSEEQPPKPKIVTFQQQQSPASVTSPIVDNVPLFLLPQVVRAETGEKPVRPAKSAPLFKPPGETQVLVTRTVETLTSKTVRLVNSSVCNIKLPNGSSGCGFLFGLDVDSTMHYGLLTTSKIVHSSYVQTYSSLRCKFGFKVVYIKLSNENFKMHLKHILFMEVSAEDREKMAKDIGALQTRPHFSATEALFASHKDDPNALISLVNVTDLDEGHFTFMSAEYVMPGSPVVNTLGILVGICKNKGSDKEYIAVKMTDIFDCIVDERRRFYTKLQRRRRRDTQASRGKAPLQTTMVESFQKLEDVLNKSVCRVEAKSGTAIGFFCSFFEAGEWHCGLFTSERVIHSRYLQNNSYVRCAIGDDDVCIPTSSYSFCCPLFGVTYIDVSINSKKFKKRGTPLKRVPFLTVNLKDYESVVVLQRLHQKETPPVIHGSIAEFRGVHFGYAASHKCRLAGAPICDPFGFVLGLQTGKVTSSGLQLGAQMRFVCDAIVRDKLQGSPNYPRILPPLKPWKIEKLEGLNLAKCNENVFVLHSSHDSVPIAWFRRTTHGWFWSPLNPLDRKMKDDAFWMRINRTDGFIVIGGKQHGKEAPAEVKSIVAILRDHGEQYL